MSIEQPGFEGEQMGSIVSNGHELQMYMSETQLPCDFKKREVCESHLAAGKANVLLDDFWMMGCEDPVEDEDPSINIQFACNGLNAFQRRCRLTLTQYGSDGEVLNKGKFTS